MFRPDFTKANPYEGVPQSYLRQIQGTPAYEQALRAGWIQPPTTFKPDYTKEDPYEGAPKEYIELVKETFKPTPEHPLPPFTGQVVSTDINKGTITVLDETGRRVEINRQDSADLFFEGIAARAASKSKGLFEEQNIKLADGKYMNREAFERLPERYRRIGETRGFDQMIRLINADNRRFERIAEQQEAALKELEPYKIGGTKLGVQIAPPGGKDRKDQAGQTTPEAYDIEKYARMGGEEKVLRAAGFPEDAIKKAFEKAQQDRGIDEHRQQYFKDRGWSLELPGINDPDRDKKLEEFQKRWDTATNDYLKKHDKTKLDLAKDFGIQIAEMTVPGVYVARNWDDLSAGKKALWIAVDIVSVLPFVGAAAYGARGVSTAGRLARLKGAAKGIAGEAVAQIRAPVDVIAHPIGTTKAAAKTVREVTENILHPSKIPEAVITTSKGTVRLKVTEATTPEQAKKIRDELMELAAKGEKPIVEVGGVKYELSRSPLMKELGGGLAHATPSGEAFEAGLTVKRKPGMPSQEQGLFLSHEPLPRFIETSAFGMKGQKPAIIILSPETAKRAISTDKLYRGPQGLVAEMERKLPVGSKLEAPKQKLFTRVGPERTRVEIWLEKPLTRGQIAKLKALDLVEQIKTPFKPAIVISHTDEALDAAKLKALNDILEESGNDDIARLLARTDEALKAGTRAVPAATRTAARKAAARTTADRTAQRTEGVRPRVKASPDEVRRAAAGEIARTGQARVTGTSTPVTRADTERADTPRTEVPRAETARTETPRTETPRADTPRTEAPRVEAPRTEPPRRDTPEGEEPPREKPPRKTIRKISLEGVDGANYEVDEKDLEGAVAWRQGAVGWWVIMQPYNDRKRALFVKQVPPQVKMVATGKGSAYRTIQLIKGAGPKRDYHYDNGIQDIKLVAKPLGLRFKRDPGQRTTGDMNLKNPARPGSARKLNQKPKLQAQRVGKVIHIPGVGLTRRMPKGRIVR